MNHQSSKKKWSLDDDGDDDRVLPSSLRGELALRPTTIPIVVAPSNDEPRSRSPLEDDAADALVGLMRSSSPPHRGSGNTTISATPPAPAVMENPACASGQSAHHADEGATNNNNNSNNEQQRHFPVVLMSILADPVNADVITWTPDGLSIAILQPSTLAQTVLPAYFGGRRPGKYHSFARKLHRYGFRRSTTASGCHDSFRHGMFRRDEPELCRRIGVVSAPSSSRRGGPPPTATAGAKKKKTQLRTTTTVSPKKTHHRTTTRTEEAAAAESNKRVTFALSPAPSPRAQGRAMQSTKQVPSSSYNNSNAARSSAVAVRPSSSSMLKKSINDLSDFTMTRRRAFFGCHSSNSMRNASLQDMFRARAAAASNQWRELHTGKNSAAAAASWHRSSSSNKTSSSSSSLSTTTTNLNNKHLAGRIVAPRNDREQAAMLRRYDPSGEAVREVLRRALEVIDYSPPAERQEFVNRVA